MVSRLIFSLVLLFGFYAGADGTGGSALLQACARNRIEPAFANTQIPAGKVHCVYGHVIAMIGGEKVSLQDAFKTGKFKDSFASLRAAKVEIGKLGQLSEDDAATVRAIDDVLMPKVLPAPSMTMTIGDLRDFHVKNMK